MKAELLLENVGQLRGKHSFSFESGKLNVIEAPNAEGKSTIIKGIAAILSLPCKSEVTAADAELLGIKRIEGGFEPLVNIYEDFAIIDLTYDEIKKTLQLTKDGSITISSSGNDKFLLSSMLVRNSRIERQFSEGIENFKWILNEMSLAKHYESAEKIIVKYLDGFSLKISDIMSKRTRTKTLEDEVEQLKNKKEEIEAEFRELQEKIESEPSEDPELKNKLKELNKQEEKWRKKISELSRDLRRKRKELEGVLNKKNHIVNELEKHERDLESVNKQIRNLPSKQNLQKWKKRAEDIMQQKVPALRVKRATERGIFNLLESAVQLSEKREKTECPLCGSRNVDFDLIRRREDVVKKEIARLDGEIASLIREHDNHRKKVKENSGKREKLDEKVLEIKGSIITLQSTLDSLEGEVKAIEPQMRERENELTIANEKLTQVNEENRKLEEQQKLLDKGEKEDLEKRGELRNARQQIERKIEEKMEELDRKSQETIYGAQVSLKIAEEIYKSIEESLKGLKERIQEKIEDQRKGAARNFNLKIHELMARLDFTEFDEISLNEHTYDLQIFRKGQKPQPIESLSGSERGAVSAMLQIAAKETYLPEIPFFIGDEIILDFDKNRAKNFLDYLLESAKRNDWFVIMTSVSENEELTTKHIGEIDSF